MKKILKLYLNNKVTIKNLIKRGGYLLSLLILLFFLSTCGKDVPYYLNPPTYFSNLSFYHAYINNPNFARGYEFFYRIYDDDTIDSSKAINDAAVFFNETTLLGLISNNTSLFENSYYRRIFPVSDNILTVFSNPALAPIMKVDPVYFDKTVSSKKFEVNINILGTGEGQITTISYIPSVGYPETINFKRYVTTDGTTFLKELFNEFYLNQNDVPNSILDSKGSIAFFVVIYGLTYQFVSVFSDVVYIGSVDNITIN